MERSTQGSSPEVKSWHNSELSTFRQCEQKWFWRYLLGWVPEVEEEPFVRGQWVHAYFATLMLSIGMERNTLTRRAPIKLPNGEVVDPQKVDSVRDQLNEKALFEWMSWDESRQQKWLKDYGEPMPDTCARVVFDWYRHYIDFVNRIEVLDVEAKLSRKRWPKATERAQTPFEGKADLVYYDVHSDSVAILDWKSFKTAIPDVDYRMLDSQMHLYLWMGGDTVQRWKPIDHAVLMYVSMKQPGHPRINKDGSLSKAQWTGTELSYRDWCGRVGREPDPDVLWRLAVKPKHYKEVVVPNSPAAQKAVLSQADATMEAIGTVASRDREPIQNVTYNCSRCPYSSLCLQERAGSPVNEEEIPYGFKKEEDDGQDLRGSDDLETWA